MKFIFLGILFLFSNYTSLFGQNYKISGWVTDTATGERLVGVSVRVLSENNGFSTDAYGFYTLNLRKGAHKICAAYVGYQQDTIFVDLRQDTILSILLKSQVLKEVVITDQSVLAENRIGVVNIPVETLKSRPMLLGEADLMKALALTPGVKTGTEGTAGLFVRGGTPDQNYVLLDGATVYNTSHLFGFLSVFNPDAVKSVALYKSGMPARYGGRLSSVIDVTMKEGNNQKKNTELSVGLISSKLLHEGPIRKGKSSYIISGRASYFGLLALPVRRNFERGKRNDYSNYWMYDLNGKLNFTVNSRSKLYLSFYTGNDKWKTLSRSGSERYDFGLNWGNNTATARYTTLLRSGMFYTTQIAYNRYQYDVQQVFFEQADIKNQDVFINRSYVEDISWKNNFQVQSRRNHRIEMGTEVVLQTLRPQGVKFDGGTILDDSIRFFQSKRYRGITAAVYAEDHIRLGRFLNLDLGIRNAIFTTGGSGFVFLEPRANLNMFFNDRVTGQISWRLNNQPVHLLATSSVGLPNEVWVPATQSAPPALSEQWSAGINVRVAPWKTRITVEVYHKTMQNLLDFRQGANLFGVSKGWEDLVVRNGNGRSYGLEFMAHRTEGRFNGWVSYTLSRSERQFKDLNRGQWFPHRYDRIHDLALTGSYQLSKKWSFASNFVFSTGDAFTAPAYFYNISNNVNSPFIQPFYQNKNGSRMPNYHRLDFTAAKSYKNRRGNTVTWSFGAYNVYANPNPFYIDIEPVPIFIPFSTQAPEKFVIYYKRGTLFTFIPSVNYAVKF